MLKTTKATTVTGQSIIKDANGTEQIVVYMSATVNENGGTPNSNVNIQDRDLYIANKKECREDMNSFDDLVDSLLGGTTDAN